MLVTAATRGTRVNGMDVDALADAMREVERDPEKGKVAFRVRSEWKGQGRSRAFVESCVVGGQPVPRQFTIDADEPLELFGTNCAPNPQELLISALNACLVVGYVVGAAARGIPLEHVEIETSGELDLRGFLGIDPAVRPGYETLRYVARLRGGGTPEQIRQIHEHVRRTSPNYFNLARPIRVDARLEIRR
jgi:uncharacterized OsmC-like protein